MRLKRILLTAAVAFTTCLATKAQTGSKYLHIAVQAARPTSSLLEVTNIGYGGAIKGMYGFGDSKQQATLEGGYNRFPVSHLPSGVNAQYSAIPLYGGYRYQFTHVALEAQAGISLNRIVGRNSQVSVSDHENDFAWALSIAYTLKGFEVSARYQNSDVKGSIDDLTFLAVRLAYNIKL